MPAPTTLAAQSSAESWAAMPRPFLFLVLDAQRPSSVPARFALDDVDQIALGRGTGPPVRVGRTLRIALGDPYVSSAHATIARTGAIFVLTDTSKNGTWVNGERLRTRTLADGDLLELGSTFFLYRTGLDATPDDLGVRTATELRAPADGLLTLIPALGQMFRELARVASAAIPVVLRGETGTGKEVVARALHALSGRSGPFVAVNCGALPETLVESELFGYKKGAFSGALEDRLGLIRSADGGTLLLDEIGDLPLSAQAALLRVLQEREVVPVGGTRPVSVDLRVISASHIDLRTEVAEKKFRADLEARLAGIEIELWPLRTRREDLGLLIGAILRRLRPNRTDEIVFEKAAARALLDHAWPKNVRELEQALASALALAGPMPVALRHLPAALRSPARVAVPVVWRAEDGELRSNLERQLAAHAGNVSAVARSLGKTRKQIQRWLKRYGLDAASHRPT